MSRHEAIARSVAYLDDGHYQQTLARRIAQRTESQDPTRRAALVSYLRDEIAPALRALGFGCELIDAPDPQGPPFLLAERLEPGARLTVLSYGHGDVVRGLEGQWRDGRDPWTLAAHAGRWYGRGTADNKGQHSVNLAALEQVIAVRGGRLGYNVKLIFEMGEELGSPGLQRVCAEHRARLGADLFLASDGPRVNARRPTLFLGSRGLCNFELRVRLRVGDHHSGNWGGLLRNPGIRLAHAIASLVDARGRILVPGLRPPQLPSSVRAALHDIEIGGGPDDPAIDPQWGEPGLTPAERVIGWNSLEVLAFTTGNPARPVHAIPAQASAHCHLRFVVGSDAEHFVAHVRRHLDAHGFDDVTVHGADARMSATRLDPDDAWVGWALRSMQRTTGQVPALLPNLGGSLPNDVFAQTLGLPTLWVPHSYPGCSQHAPDEHLLVDVARESLAIMAGLFWDLAEHGGAVVQERRDAVRGAPG
jgi:acetylornithine deacetylase/succinyl-diaminopimelate desuccinylase-like protein